LLLPGLFDTHNHVNGRARELFWVMLGNQLSPHTLEGYRQTILDFRAKHPDLKQLRGRGFDGNILPAIGQSRKRQPRQLLDDIVSDIPAYIQSWTGHQGWANTKALELAGITKDTPDPPDEGAKIDHDPATGEPNGIVHENGAMNLIVYKLPEPDMTVEQYRAGILSFQREVSPPRGITSILVPTDSRAENLDTAMQQLSDEGLLTLHISAAQWVENQLGVKQVPELVAGRAQFHGGRYFTFNVIKLSAPWPQEPLNQTIAALDKQGFQVYVHQTGSTGRASVLEREYIAKRPHRGLGTSYPCGSISPLAARRRSALRAMPIGTATDCISAQIFTGGVPLIYRATTDLEASPKAENECVKHNPIEARRGGVAD
jgi:predicted amidohydrolase YtcJ